MEYNLNAPIVPKPMGMTNVGSSLTFCISSFTYSRRYFGLQWRAHYRQRELRTSIVGYNLMTPLSGPLQVSCARLE